MSGEVPIPARVQIEEKRRYLSAQKLKFFDQDFFEVYSYCFLVSFFGWSGNAKLSMYSDNSVETYKMKLAPPDRTEQQVFDELEELCGSSGYIHALAYFAYRDNTIGFVAELKNEDLEKSYAPSRLIRTEFTTLMGLMMKHPINFEIPAPSEIQRKIDRTESLLVELHNCLSSPMFEFMRQAVTDASEGKPVEQKDPFLRADVLREPIFYCGESAYSFQYQDFALKRYAYDDKWLLDNKGFTISHACRLSSAISKILNRKIMSTIKELRNLDFSVWTLLPGFTFSVFELVQEARIEETITAAFLDAMTAPSAPTNINFTSLGEFNLASAFPIVKAPDNHYVSLQGYGLVEALYDSPFYWMAADKAYKNTAFMHRGAFTEDFVKNRMEEVFGKPHVHQGIKIYDKQVQISEIDVLVVFADRAVIFQCKSKKLTLEARKGNDLRLQDDFKKSVQDAYDQGALCAKSLRNPNLRFVLKDGAEITFPVLNELYIVCVVSDHYPALTIQADKFLKFETDDKIQPPLVTDIFLIDVLAEMLSSPLRLLSYINRRVNYRTRVFSINELTILAYHLKQNLWLEDKMDRLVLADDISIDLDTAMIIRREGIEGKRTPDGILTRLEGTLVGRWLQSIENRPEAALVDLGFLLLRLSTDGLEDINQGVEQIRRLTNSDTRIHDITIVFSNLGTGITIYCSTLPNALVAEKLEQHCRLRKYAHKADSWFGLVVREDDGFPKFGMNFRFPWKQDHANDEKIKNLSVGRKSVRKGRTFKLQKTGRNESCPCGSGKKFKNCCLSRNK